MPILKIVGIILAVLIAIFLLHHLVAHLLKLNPEWKDELEAIETVGWYGPFYINKDDNRVFLPKRYGIGFTFNLGRPGGIIITAALIGFIIWAIIAGSHSKTG